MAIRHKINSARSSSIHAKPECFHWNLNAPIGKHPGPQEIEEQLQTDSLQEQQRKYQRAELEGVIQEPFQEISNQQQPQVAPANASSSRVASEGKSYSFEQISNFAASEATSES